MRTATSNPSVCRICAICIRRFPSQELKARFFERHRGAVLRREARSELDALLGLKVENIEWPLRSKQILHVGIFCTILTGFGYSTIVFSCLDSLIMSHYCSALP